MVTIHPKPTVSDLLTTPYLNIGFPVQGTHLPADHGYSLYATITQTLPALHGSPWLGIELISGIPWDKGMIALPTHGTNLQLRLPAEHFAAVLPLAGKRLELAGHAIRLGVPLARPLMSASSLYARIVTIKQFTEPEPFLDAARRQLTTLGINAALELPRDGRTRYRRIISIHGKKVVGFSVVARGLSDEDSLILQSLGLGGRRTMGCGLFNPITNTSYPQGHIS
jgi:CRISPR-associated protein Cas6